MSTIIRVFPRRTNATPADDDARVGPPTLFDVADEIHISVTWTWDRPKAERLAKEWEVVAPVKIGGPAYDDPGGEFTPGLYLKNGYVITSRGCPNHCWFCSVPRREGQIREIEIKSGWNVLDSNLLACSRSHVEGVFRMLENQSHRPRFTGGLEAKRLESWHAERIAKLNPETIWMAYDTPDDWEPLMDAAKLLSGAGLIRPRKTVRCYVLIGWERDTIDAAEKRLTAVCGLGIMPMAMLYNHGENRKNDRDTWISFAREWANPWVVGSKMKLLPKFAVPAECER